jgi:predicted deacetylase
MQTAPPNSSVPSAHRGDSRALVVSIHDVSTVTRARVAAMLEDLARVGVSVTSLLVIPDHHYRGRIDQDPVFAPWLRDQVSAGHEAVLHGYHHLRPIKAGEGMTTRLITRHYTAGEGEFHDLSYAEASELLRRGKEALAGCGVPFTGFIAPAWLLGAEAERAVRDEGFAYTTRIGSVIDSASGHSFASRSMVYSVRAPWRCGLSLLWNESLFRILKNAPLLRIGLHPPDWDHPAIRRHLLRCLCLAASSRTVTSYGEWLDQWRRSGHEGRKT